MTTIKQNLSNAAQKTSNWRNRIEYRHSRKWLTYSSQIARRVLAAIEDKEGFNQTKLAQALDVSPQRISDIVKGRENLTLEAIYNLSQALKTELISFPEYKYNRKIFYSTVENTEDGNKYVIELNNLAAANTTEISFTEISKAV